MSEYTPTTEEVRKGYAGALYLSEVPRDRSEEFDRWLAEVKEQAWDEGFREGLDGDRGDPNPYRQRERSGNSNSQPTAETSNLLNKGEI